MELYRRANVFERILTLYISPLLGESTRRKILHVVYRAAQVGGSTTLITRAAILDWILMQLLDADAKEAAFLRALGQKIFDTCDRERVDAWSRGAVAGLVDQIVQV